MTNHFSSLVVDELSTASKKIKINGALTLGENIADIGGNRLSYYAYCKLIYITVAVGGEKLFCFIIHQFCSSLILTEYSVMGVRKWRRAPITWIDGFQSTTAILDS